MKNNKILVSIILIITVLAICTAVFADINPNDYRTTLRLDKNGETMQMTAKVVGVINTIGVIVLIVTVIIVGFKYIVGSIEERAEYKKTMMPIIIGAILLFATSTAINLVYNFVKGTGLDGWGPGVGSGATGDDEGGPYSTIPDGPYSSSIRKMSELQGYEKIQ